MGGIIACEIIMDCHPYFKINFMKTEEERELFGSSQIALKKTNSFKHNFLQCFVFSFFKLISIFIQKKYTISK